MIRLTGKCVCGVALTLLAVVPLSGCNGHTTKPGTGPDKVAEPVNEPAPPPPLTFTLVDSGLPVEGFWKCDPVLVDVNQDGFLDIAAHIRLGKGPHIWLGNGGTEWREASDGLSFDATSCGGGIDFGDVNEDGLLDMVVADHCKGVYVYLGDNAGGWKMVVSELYPEQLIDDNPDVASRFYGAEDVCLGDVNNDGHLDMVTGSADSGGIALYLGDGSGITWIYQQCALPSSDDWTLRVQFADFNRDGYLDLAATCGKGPRVFLNDTKGDWIPSFNGMPTPMMGGIYAGLDVADFNDDGLLDVVVGNDTVGPEIYLQQQDGSWAQTNTVFREMEGGTYGVKAGDINGDGHLDLVCTGRFEYTVGYVYGIFVLLGDGQGHWKFIPNSGLPITDLEVTWGVTIGDFSNDGVPDVVVATGGYVATDAERTEPILPARVQAWKTHLADAAEGL